MKTLYVILDTASRVFSGPYPHDNDDVMKRALAAACQPGHLFYTNPSDFLIHTVGVFDDETGEVIGGAPQLVCTMKEILAENGRDPDAQVHMFPNLPLEK